MIREALYLAAINCPHAIDSNRIVLHFDPKQPGHNALNQLGLRLSAAAAAATVAEPVALTGLRLARALMEKLQADYDAGGNCLVVEGDSTTVIVTIDAIIGHLDMALDGRKPDGGSVFSAPARFKCSRCGTEMTAGEKLKCDKGPCPMDPVSSAPAVPLSDRLSAAAGLLAGHGHKDSYAAVLEARDAVYDLDLAGLTIAKQGGLLAGISHYLRGTQDGWNDLPELAEQLVARERALRQFVSGIANNPDEHGDLRAAALRILESTGGAE
ncbi:hypothetical protein [Burkholderia anthina]|uniref:hypothetical protein n=1 Tax=Burkholderia anthina TaxID=179879 RepID=UPI00158D963D|nr:hypothetical protein [Burkholderia anthina]